MRVGSPSPGFSILITSAPNHAKIWVHVGPDWTCVMSSTRTPSKAFAMIALSRSLGLMALSGAGGNCNKEDSPLSPHVAARIKITDSSYATEIKMQERTNARVEVRNHQI